MKPFLFLSVAALALAAGLRGIRQAPVPQPEPTIAAPLESARTDGENADSNVPEGAIAPSQTAARRSGAIAEVERQVFEQINEYRAERGLPALRNDERIGAIARGHSQAMADGGVPFSHQGVQRRYEDMKEVRSWRRVAENVAYNAGYRDPGDAAVVGWLDSDGHRRNIEGDFDYTGIGIAKNGSGEYYFTQLFLRSTASSQASTRKQSGSTAEMERQVLAQINEYRAERGLPALKNDERIGAIARGHSQDMADGTVPFSHQGVQRRYEEMGEVRSWRRVAENVAYNYGQSDPGDAAVVGWLGSDGHRRNIEGNFDYTGIGIAKNSSGEYYFTQLFLSSR